MAALVETATSYRALAATELSDVTANAPEAEQPGFWRLGGLFRRYRRGLVLAYLLVIAENILLLIQPWALGNAINDLLASSHFGLGLLIAVYFGHLVVSAARRSYDARVFSRIYAQLATDLVENQRGQNVATSRIAARSSLSREFVSFFQVYLPLVCHALFSIVGAIVMLCFYDWMLMLICFALVAPACVANIIYSRKVLRLNARLHDELEREVEVIQEGNTAAVRDHYVRASAWRIKLANTEAINFSVIELFVIALLAIALLRSCMPGAVNAGDIIAIFRYVIMFITALDALPVLIQHVCRLRDIGRRMRHSQNRTDPNV